MELFQLFGKIAIDNSGANESIDETTNKASGFSEKIGSVMAVVGKAAMAAAAAVATAMAAIGTAIVNVTKEALENYADYEQLVGGAELMFGEAYDFVAEKAASAYKTVQMSQNDYLKQMNGFATGLKTALDGDAKAAAVLADKILTAEADVVAATGNSQEAVQNAFNGIMKSNYTMLDNLQLGITPTKEGFQEVIDKVNEWNAANGEATHYQIENLADAEAALVDYVKMQGLAGYASAEASETITGSLTSVKAAWQNLLTGMADGNQDINVLINNLVDSAVAFGNNIIPRISEALPRVVEGITTLVEKASTYLPDIMAKLVPSLITGTTSLLLSIAKKLPVIISNIVPTVVESLNKFMSSVLQELPTIFESLLGEVGGDLGEVLGDLFGQLYDGAMDILPKFMEALSELEALLPVIVDSLMPLTELIGPLFELLGEIMDLIIALLPLIIQLLQVILPPLVSMLVNVISYILPQLTASLKELTNIITTYVIPFVQKLMPLFSQVFQIILNLLQVFLDGVVDTLQGPLDYILSVINIFIALFQGDLDSAFEYVKEALEAALNVLLGILKTICPVIVLFIKSGFLDKIKNFFVNTWNSIKTTVSNVANDIYNTVSSKFNNIYNAISNTMTNAFNKVNDMINRIKNAFNFSWSLPHLKMPHISISGGWSLKPPSAPTFSVDWYAKAMDNPMLLTEPTAFGINSNGQIMAGGESGPEVVSGAETLMNMIGDAVARQDEKIEEALGNIVAIMSQYMPQIANMNVVMDSGVLVGELAPSMDMALGTLATRSERGIR